MYKYKICVDEKEGGGAGGRRRREEGRDAFKTSTHTPRRGGKNEVEPRQIPVETADARFTTERLLSQTP